MKLPPRVLSVVFVLGLSVAGAICACPSCPSDLGFDFWNFSALKDELARQNQIRVHLECQDATALQRIAVKEEIVGEIVAGRMGLLDAAARFHALNADRADIMAALRAAYPSACDEECLCRNVISYVESRLQDSGPSDPQLVRLHAELEHWLANGAGRLPDSPSLAGLNWKDGH